MVVFLGPRLSPEREAQFSRFLQRDAEVRRRGLNNCFANPAQPAFCKSDDEWRTVFLHQPTGVSVVRSAAKARVPVRNLRATTVPWDDR